MSDAYFDPHSRRPLDEVGLLHGTDKSSICHGYLDHYARNFEHLRAAPINIVEIGVFNGASVRTWADYFPNAQIIGVDIQERCRVYTDGRIVIEIGSQADAAFLEQLVRRYPPTIVIEDGSHQPAHQVFTFEHLYPAVAPGGCYVVEDVHLNPPAMREQTIASGTPWPADYFAAFAIHMMSSEVLTVLDTPVRRALLHQTRRVEMIHGAALLWKHDQHRFQRPHDIAWLFAMVEATDLDFNWQHLGHFLTRANAEPSRIVSAFERSVGLSPGNVHYWNTLLAALAQCGDPSLTQATLGRHKNQVPPELAQQVAALLRG